MAPKHEHVSVAIALLALIVSGGSLYVAVRQTSENAESLKTQQAQLDEQKRAFEATTPKTSAVAHLSVYDATKKSWLPDPAQGSTLDPALVAQGTGHQMEIYFQIKNEGAAADSITGAGIYISKTSKVAAADADCYVENRDTTGSRCDFPVALESNERLQLWFVLTPEMVAALTCNTYAQQGTVAYLTTRSSGTVSLPTMVAVPTAGFCQHINQQPNK